MASKLFDAPFSVTRKATELITPARPAARVIKQLSDIDDQEGLRFHVPLIFFYKNNPSPAVKEKDPVKVIREALSRALEFYYPLAGRLKEGTNRKLTVDCNNEGVFFTEADANVKLEQFGDEIQVPCPYLDQLLCNVHVPSSEGILGCPLLLIQVTRLICGGFILALSFNHTMCDGFGLIQFLKALEEMTRGLQSPSVLPIWQRELLDARDPPRITCIHHEYEHIENVKYILNTNTNDIDHKSFYFGPKEITALRNHLPQRLRNCSTFDLLTACLWKCRTIALEPEPNDIVRVSFAVNLRGKHYYKMLIPPGFYGNVIAIPAACSKADNLCKNSLEYAVDLVKKTKAKVNEEYLRSVSDLMVIKGRPKYVTEGNFFVSDTTGLGFEKVDLGWGKPLYGGAAGVTSVFSPYVKCQKRDGENGIVVPIRLPLSTMKSFQEEIKKMIQGRATM